MGWLLLPLAILGLSSLHRCGAEGEHDGGVCKLSTDCESGCCVIIDWKQDVNISMEKEFNCAKEEKEESIKCLKELGIQKSCQPQKACKKVGFIIIGVGVVFAVTILGCLWISCCKKRAEGKELLQDRYVQIE